MSDKKLNAIKEIEFRINAVKQICSFEIIPGFDYFERFDEIDNILFDINDFINDLKDE